jgi:hypothetical protein
MSIARTRHALRLAEPLEPRLLFSAAVPTNDDQLFIELLNRARANPNQFVTDFGLAVSLADVPATAPLAVNPFLTDSAEFHAHEMADHNYLDHQSAVTGKWPNQMVREAGYPLPTDFYPDGYNGVESIAGGTLFSGPLVALKELLEDGGFPLAQAFHRQHLMGYGNNVTHNEVGIGHAYNGASIYGHYWVVHTALDGTNSKFVTGVAFTDAVTADNFYTIGEGLGGVTITATPVGGGAGTSTTTFASGGYSLRLASGTYDVTASGGAFTTPKTVNNVVVGADNVKVDFKPVVGDTTPPTATGTGAGLGHLYAQNPNLLKFSFSEDVVGLAASALQVRAVPDNADVAVTLQNYDAGTHVATFALPGALPADGNYRATLLATGVHDAAGNQMAADMPLDFFILRGDADHDRTVGPGDFNLLASHFGQTEQNWSTGDFDGDGTVGPGDFNLLASRFGTTLDPANLIAAVGKLSEGTSSAAAPSRTSKGVLNEAPTTPKRSVRVTRTPAVRATTIAVPVRGR